MIILGEGVISLFIAMQKLGSTKEFRMDIAVSLFCGITIIYLIWVFYIDETTGHRTGTWRLLFWTILHFPYHVSVLFVLEGSSQLCTWRKVLNYWSELEFKFDIVKQSPAWQNLNVSGIVKQLKGHRGWLHRDVAISHGHDAYSDFEKTTTRILDGFDQAVRDWNSNLNTSQLQEKVQERFNQILYRFAVYAGASLGIEPPKAAQKLDNEHSNIETFQGLVKGTFSAVFVYLFACAGTVLILNAALFLFGNRRNLRGDHIDSVFKMAVGVALVGFGIRQSPAEDEVYSRFADFQIGRLPLPTILFIYLSLLISHNLIVFAMRKVLRKTAGVEILAE